MRSKYDFCTNSLIFGSTDQICHYGLYCCNLVLDLFLFDAPHTSVKNKYAQQINKAYFTDTNIWTLPVKL